MKYYGIWALQGAQVVKNPHDNAGDTSLIPDRKISWRRKWQSTPVFLPGKSHEQWSLERYSPWSCKELYMTATEHTLHIMLYRQKLHSKKNVQCFLFFFSCGQVKESKDEYTSIKCLVLSINV